MRRTLGAMGWDVSTAVAAGLSVGEARARVAALLADQSWRGDADAALIAVHEALINAEQHGGGIREVTVHAAATLVRIEVADNGERFEPDAYIHERPDLLAERGRGLWLMNEIAAAVSVHSEENGNRLVLEFAAKPTTSAGHTGNVTRDAGEAWTELEGAQLIAAVGGAAMVVDEHLVVRAAYGRFEELFGLSRDHVSHRDARGLASEMKRLFADPYAFEDQTLAEYAHPDRRGEDVVIMADGRLLRRHSVPLGDRNARLVVYLPAGEHTQALAAMQRALLPDLPDWDDLDVGAIYHPAEATAFVGGDFYDFFALTEGGRCVLIGDVSGRGAAAAASSTKVRAYLRASLASQGVASAVASLDATLTGEFTEEEFVTLAMCLQESTNVWTLTNCGHNEALLLRDGAVTELPAGGPILGVGLGGPWVRQPFTFRTGDLVLLYTDGVTDAGRREEFGLGRLTEALIDFASLPAQQLVEAIDNRLHAFALNAISDDHVILVMRAR